MRRVKARISALTRRRQVLWDVNTVVKRLNRQLLGWANYFAEGSVMQAYRNIDHHAEQRLRQWLGAKHKQQGLRHDLYPHEFIYEKLKLVHLTRRKLATVRGRHG